MSTVPLPAHPAQQNAGLGTGPTGPVNPTAQLTQPPDDGAERYIALQERVFFELLGGIERQFGRDQAVGIVSALAKKYPTT